MSHPVVEECPHEMCGAVTGSLGVTPGDANCQPSEEPIVARDCAGQNPGMYAHAGASPFIKGVVNLRGLVVPVFDLKVRFNPSQGHPESLNLQMVTDDACRVVGAVPNEAGAVIEMQGMVITALAGIEADDEIGPITGIGLVERADKPGTLILAYVRQKAPNPVSIAPN